MATVDVEEAKRTFCNLCPAGCGLVVTVRGERVVRIRGDEDSPTHGYTCSKGRALGAVHHAPDRLDHPYLRRKGRLEQVSWDELLDDLAARLRDVVDEHGPEAVGMFIGGGGFSEGPGYTLADRFFRKLGTPCLYSDLTIDNSSKFLAAEMVCGFPGMLPKVDQEGATFVLFLGINPVISHGHMGGYVDPISFIRRVRERGQVWVLDPRRSESARLATRHLAPRAGTDHVVLAHLVRELLRDGADHEYLARCATGVDELTRAVEPFDGPTAAAASGLGEDELADLVAAIRAAGRIAVQTGTGVTMGAAAPVAEWLVWALLAVTRSLDTPGGMWFDVGHQRLDRKRRPPRPVDGVTSAGPRSRPELAGRLGEHPCVAVPDEIDAGNLRAFFALGGNVLAAFPDANRVRASLQRLELFVVAEIVHNEVTELATHVMPCTGVLERSRALPGRYRPPVLAPAGERRPMWWSFSQLGRRMGVDGLLPGDPDPDTVTEDDFLSSTFPGGPVTVAEMVAAGSVAHPGPLFGWFHENSLGEEGWRLAPPKLVERLGQLGPPAPLVLVPRRQPRHVNAQLRGQGDRPELFVHPDDAAEAGVADGQLARVTSASGSIRMRARVDPHLRRGVVSIPHGWAEANVNELISCTTDVDPLTGMPLMSGTPVSLGPG
jgi:anaerobic selenocysteine-containing dehydrogenase